MKKTKIPRTAFKKGHIPWNKDLTKKDDKRLKLVSEKVSKKMHEKYSSGEIDKFAITKKANETLRKFGQPKLRGKKLTKEHKEKISKAIKGRNSPMLGKYHSEETKKKMSISTRKWMLNGGAAYLHSKNKNPSKGQVSLYNNLKKVFPLAELNYPIKIREDKHYSLDVAEPKLKINYEYDGSYWHSDIEQQLKDEERDWDLINNGWCVVRISDTEEEIKLQ